MDVCKRKMRYEPLYEMQHLTKTFAVIYPWAKNATGKILTCPKYCVLIFVRIYPQL